MINNWQTKFYFDNKHFAPGKKLLLPPEIFGSLPTLAAGCRTGVAIVRFRPENVVPICTGGRLPVN
jgi:hypothetical protein